MTLMLKYHIVEDEIPERGLWNPQISGVGSWNQRRPTSSPFIRSFLSCNYKCTSKVVTPDNKRTMAENTASWSETAQELKEDDNLKLKLLFHKFTVSSTYISYSRS